MAAPSSSARRVVFVDLARSFAVFLALFNHALTILGGWVAVGRHGTGAIRFVSCVATPSFIILAGAMLELVYFKIWVTQGGATAARRLLRRARQCYTGFFATIVASVVAGALTPGGAVRAAVFLGDTRFGNILKFYVFALTLAIPLLAIRRRFGLVPAIVFGLAPWLLVPWIDRLPWPPPSSAWSYLTATLMGRPVRRASISMWHALALVVIGMAIGRSVRWAAEHGGDLRVFRRVAGGVAAACAAIGAVLCVVAGPRTVVSNFVFDVYRYAHHVGYYALGTLESMLLLLALAWWWPPGEPASPRWKPALVFGHSSLLAFTLGSVLLDMIPPRHLGLVASFGGALAFTAAVAVLLLLIERYWWEPSSATVIVQRSTIVPRSGSSG